VAICAFTSSRLRDLCSTPPRFLILPSVGDGRVPFANGLPLDSKVAAEGSLSPFLLPILLAG